MSFLYPALTILTVFLFLLNQYSRRIARKPRIHAKEGKLKDFILENLSIIHKIYYPCWWCPWGIPQTLFRVLLRRLPKLAFEREIVDLSDGGCLAIDWLNPKNNQQQAPIIIMLPGMTSSTHDCAYILYSAKLANRKGYRVVVVNPRGLGGIPLKTARTYNPSKTDDLDIVVKLINERFPTARKLGVGFSLGGMSLFNYLVSKCKNTVGLSAAMIISSPWDPIEASFVNEQFWSRILFNKFLSKVLRDYVKPYKHLFEDKFDWERAMSLKSVREYDHFVTAPLFGHNDWAEYYHQAALYHHHKIHSIPIPTLCLNAKDDCFSPLSSIPFEELKKTKNLISITTKHGGHLAFMRSGNPSSIGLDELVLSQYSDAIFGETFIDSSLFH
ncbi:unnamed protein product, partial [Mesorhabditis belari]|uniref:AB hydrolase-1 domain-containing protein n=1 Tax=Mesorhabditis belari TaxID=2138241 RepID=A0AAF3FQC5_9BILA